MPKYLNTFACVAGKTAAAIEKLCLGGDTGDSLPAAVNEVLWKALRKRIDDVACFRSVMDGWNDTRDDVGGWVARARPQAARMWKEFRRQGVLLLRPGSRRAGLLLPEPKWDRVQVGFKKALNLYAVQAFFAGLYDSLVFHACTETCLVMTACALGPVCDDNYWLGRT